MTYGRLAQLVEHLLDVQEVTGSSPVPSTTIPRPFGLGIFLWWTVQDENRAALRFPVCKFHSIGDVFSLTGVVYSV